MSALHRRGSVKERQLAILNRVEFEEVTPPMAPATTEVGTPWQEPKGVWVYSKGQAPYLFLPWASPCSPNEWPYNLEALRGTEDFEDILAWHCGKYPDVTREDLNLYLELLLQHVGDRQISVQIHHDIDTQERYPWFTAWGFDRSDADEDDDRMLGFKRARNAVPALDHLFCRVGVSMEWCSFEDRHVSDKE
ncbi:hypothetical protein [Roseateles chitinivorans]|uniref:hypothetical protein n=1 Tax=Roseateles chitinivorans TaxID=2917965 RepID=UPI003D66F5D1